MITDKALEKRPQLTVEPQSRALASKAARFERYNGKQVLASFLQRAGMTGDWTYRIFDTFPSTGRTPPVQVRNVNETGIVVWCKPGSNDSGVKGSLTGPPGTDLRVAHDALQEGERTGGDRPAETYADVTATTRAQGAVLVAIERFGRKTWPTMNEFLGGLTVAIFRNSKVEIDDTAELVELVEPLVSRGLVERSKTGMTLTIAGRIAAAEAASLEALRQATRADEKEAEEAKEEAEAVEEVEAVKAADAVPELAAGPLELIEANRARITRLLEMPELVRACRNRQAELNRQIEALMEELDLAAAREAELMGEFDGDAIRLLFEPKGTS